MKYLLVIMLSLFGFSNGKAQAKSIHSFKVEALDGSTIDFSKSIMVGNRTSDMEFGRNAKMHTVFLATTHPETAFPNNLMDYRFNNLLEFAEALK